MKNLKIEIPDGFILDEEKYGNKWKLYTESVL